MRADPIRFSAVVLAAGMSTRMQGRNKLLMPVADETVIRCTVRNLLQAQPRETVVVVGFEASMVSEALSGLPIRVQANPRFEEGQMTSVAAGVGALQRDTDAVMVCLGDMVLLTAADYRELIDRYARLRDKSILVPRFQGQRGNPVIFAHRRVPDVVAGRRNPGCRDLIANHPEDVFGYQATHDRFVIDLDTPEDYVRILSRLGSTHVPLRDRAT
jgi:molybdenum cofactor cytidylyltransferase